MKISSKIREHVSQIFDVLIPEGKWQDYFDMLDRDGHPNRKELLSLILSFAKHIETLENLVEDLYFQIELLEGKKATIAPQKVEFKLRTPIDVQKELEASITSDTKCFYISSDDFKILEKTINPQLAKTKPEYGYGKEIDPKDNTEKVCLYYKDLPVFKK